jgi:hypothetical protein
VKNEKLLRQWPQLPQGTTTNIHQQKNAEKKGKWKNLFAFSYIL